MEPFLGSWKLETSENFDDVMKELGVSLITRKIAQNISPILIVSSLGDGQYKMRSESAFKNTEFEFMLGEEFEEETPDGRIVRSTITIDGNTLKQVQVGNKTTYIDRVVEGNKLKAVIQVGGAVSTRIYEKI
uniref:FABP domain-containing protein n=1 Tax=Mesocestoides corti TaxID=53468 RepID=A0A5K3FWA6_MESCO